MAKCACPNQPCSAWEEIQAMPLDDEELVIA